MYERGAQSQPAEFVKERYSRLRTMLDIIADHDWRMSDEDRQRVVNALACFSTPAENAPSSVLDHAIMIELVSRDLHHDLDAYRDFCKFRESILTRRSAAPSADRAQWLQQKGAAPQERMHKRHKRDLDAAGSSVEKLFSLFRL